MRETIFLLLFIHSSLRVAAQEKKPLLEGIYFSMGGNLEWTQEKSAGAVLGVSGYGKSGFGLAAHWRHTIFEGKPSDYVPASEKIIGGSPAIRDIAYTYSLAAAYKYRPKGSKHFQFGLETGPSLLNYHEIIFTRQPVVLTPGFFKPNTTSNYSTSLVNSQTIGLIVAARAELVVSSWMGLEFGFWSNLNKKLNLTGTELLLTLGRKKRSQYLVY